MYINLHTKSHIFLKIGIFCKTIITFSGSAHLMKKSTFLSNFIFFLHKINIFAPKLILTEILVTLTQSWRHYYITVLGNSLIAKKLTFFGIKCYFYNATKNWHFSKTEDTSLRKLNISFKNEHFWKMVTICYKNEKKSFKIGVSARFSIYKWSLHNEKINTSKTNCHFFQNWQLKYF